MAKAFFSGIPKEAPGPVEDKEIPTLMSASAAWLNNATAAEHSTASFLTFIFAPLVFMFRPVSGSKIV